MENEKKYQMSRNIDSNVGSSFAWVRKNYVAIQKKEIKAWQAVVIISFVTGLALGGIWLARTKSGVNSKASTQNATLSFSSPSVSVAQGDTFPINVLLNTGGNNVVVAKADISYNPTNFQLVGNPDTSSSVFAANNACLYNGKACEIVSVDAIAGKVSITLAKPTPGVNTAAGIMGTLFFKALNPVGANANDIKLDFSGSGSYSDSDVIVDDGNGTDVLVSVAPLSVQVAAVNGTQAQAQITTNTSSSSSDSKHKKKSKKSKKGKSSSSMKIANSPRMIASGGILIQAGNKFTPNGSVRLYFGNGKGGYYPPKTVKTNASGGFALAYRVNKPKGSYNWYAMDVKTGKKSNTATYKVK